MEFTIIAYGSGEVLEKLFNGIASLIGGKDATLFGPLVRMGLLIGLLLMTIKVIFNNQMQLMTHWMVPAYIILNTFFTPMSTVWIKDVVSRDPPYKVDHVPWGLAAFAGLMSHLRHTITERIESSFADVDDFEYHKTGSFFASHVIASSKKARILNTDLQETMREFVSQCIVYDALLGVKYTLNDLRQSDNLWELVSQNPSPARSFTFKAPGKGQRSRICTCKEGVPLLKPLLTVEVDNCFQTISRMLFPKHYKTGRNNEANNLFKTYLPGAFSLMTGQASQASDIMLQEMMMHATLDGIEAKSVALGNAPNPAVRRAYLQDRTSQETIGAVAAQKLVSMKNVLEALIYAAFIFILPLCMLPSGWRFLKIWVELVIWIHLWPPIYGVLHGIMMMTLKHKSLALAGGSGLTLANSSGLYDLHADMAAMASYLSLSVGAISYAIIKGGSAGFSGLTGPLTSTITSVGSRAADDMSSGNFNFGNVSVGGVQAYNSGFGQQNWSPSFSSGAFSQNDGLISKTTAASGDHMITMAQSSFRDNISGSSAVQQSLQNMATELQSATNQVQIAKSKAMEQSVGSTLDFASHVGKTSSLQKGYGDSRTIAISDSAQRLDSLVNSFAAQNGITKQQAISALASASASASVGNPGGKGLSGSLGGTGSYNYSHTDSDLYQKAKNFSDSSNFQSALSETQSMMKDNRFNVGDDRVQKIAESFQASERAMESLNHSESVLQQQGQNISNAMSWSETHGGQINRNLNDEFFSWFQNQIINGNRIGERTALTMMHTQPDRVQAYEKRFLEEKTKSLHHDIKANLSQIQNQINTSLDKAPSSLDSSAFEASKASVVAKGNTQGVNLNHKPDYDVEAFDKRIEYASNTIASSDTHLNEAGDDLAHKVKNETFGPSVFGYKPLNKK